MFTQQSRKACKVLKYCFQPFFVPNYFNKKAMGSLHGFFVNAKAYSHYFWNSFFLLGL